MNIKNLAMWAVIVFLTIGLYNMFKNPQSNVRGGNQIIFSEFLTSVENGEVLKVEIQGNNINGISSQSNLFLNGAVRVQCSVCNKRSVLGYRFD